MQETTKETTVSFSAPAGTYYAGQQVPIVATFDYPVKITEDMTITVNDDQTLTPEEVETTGESCTFLYPVTETSGGAISVTAANFVGDEPTCQLEGANKLELTISRGDRRPDRRDTGISGPGTGLWGAHAGGAPGAAGAEARADHHPAPDWKAL